MSNRLTTLGIALLILVGCARAEPDAAREEPQPSSVVDERAIDSQVEARMETAGMVGLGAAIIVNKKVVWTKGYGFADRENAVPFTPKTIMNVGSISKTFTGVAIMRAVQDGMLSLDEDINRYLPFQVVNPHFPDFPITLRHLATHTSSITDEPSVYDGAYHFGGDSPEPLGAYVTDYFSPEGAHYSKSNYLEVRPGTHREYSNIAAALAGYIVEVAAGERLNTYTKQNIFKPLGMDGTGWFLSEIDVTKHATLYDQQEESTVPIELYGLTTYPDGGVRTSVADLAKFFIALLNGGELEGTRILDPDVAREMLRFQFTESSKPDNVELTGKNSGIFWATKNDVTRIGHGGSDPGMRADMFSDLSKEFGVILFTNTSLGDAAEGQYVGILNDLWNHAEAHLTSRAATSTQ